MIFSKEINILEIIFLNTIVNDIVYLNYWELQVRLIDNNYDTVLDKTYCNVGDTTTFQSVAQPELSEEGNLRVALYKYLKLLEVLNDDQQQIIFYIKCSTTI